MPKDIYLLMRPELIRATLAGQKWQTRRLVKPQPQVLTVAGGKARWFGWPPSAPRFGPYCERYGMLTESHLVEELSPYGKPGDLAVVRESFRLGKSLDHMKPSDAIAQAHEVGYGETIGPVWYEADGAYRRWGDDDLGDFGGKGKLRGPYEMPRCAARIVRPITEIKVERVAEISEADALAEGVGSWRESWDTKTATKMFALAGSLGGFDKLTTAQCIYRMLWNEINAKPKPRYGREGGKKVITHYEAFPWSLEDFDALYPGARESGTWKGKPLMVRANPFVWCISFERKEALYAD